MSENYLLYQGSPVIVLCIFESSHQILYFMKCFLIFSLVVVFSFIIFLQLSCAFLISLALYSLGLYRSKIFLSIVLKSKRKLLFFFFKSFGGSGGQNNAPPCPPPKDFHFLFPRTCEYVTLLGKRDFAEVIILRILRWDYLGLSRYAQCNHKGPWKGWGGKRVREGVKAEAEVEVMRLLALKMKESQEPSRQYLEVCR